MIESVFISRNLKEISKLEEFCKKNEIPLTATSLIQFKKLPFALPKDNFDVIFFNSPRSVEFFYQKYEFDSTQIACMGEGTAKKLIDLNIPVDFIGQLSSKPNLVFTEFKKWLRNKKVLSPIGNKSLMTLREYIPNHQISFVQIYETQNKPIKLPSFDLYIFSSPSNLDSFFQSKNLTKKNAKIISWGSSTTSAMLDKNLFPDFELKNSSEQEILDILSNL